MQTVPAALRPKLKPDVYWVPHPEGAVFVHPTTHLTVRGNSALPLMDRLAPYLTGEVTLGELVADLSEGKREMVTTLVGSLLSAGLIKDVSGDEPHGLTDEELRLYAAEISYIDYYVGSAARRFETYRTTPVVCVGSGLTLTALVHACLAAGVRHVHALITDECPTDADRLDEYARLAAERDPAQRLTHRSVSGGDPGTLAALIDEIIDASPYHQGAVPGDTATGAMTLGADTGTDTGTDAGEPPAAVAGDGTGRGTSRRPSADAGGVATEEEAARGVVLHVSDRPMAGRAAWLDRLCRERGLVLVQGVADGDEAWTGPVSGVTGPLWTAAWLRRAAGSGRLTAEALAGTGFGDDGAGEPSPFLAGPTAAIVANRVSFAAFRYVTGIADADPHAGDPARAGRAAISVVDLETLRTAEHRFHPHPGAYPAGPESAEEFAARYAAFRAAVRPSAEEFSALAAGCYDPGLGLFTELDEGELAQLPLFAARARVSDPFGHAGTGSRPPQVTGAGLSQAQARQEAGAAALAAYAALAVDPRRLAPGGQAYAHNLVLEKDELIPAERAYPALAARPFRIPVGLAAGADADAALVEGLLAHVTALTAAAVRSAAEPYPLVDLDAAAPPEPAGRYLEALRAARVPLAVHDVTGPLGVPVYALCAGERTIAYAAGPRLAAGLARVLLDHQRVPTHLDGDAPGLPAGLRGTRTVPLRDDPAPDWRTLTRILHAHGHQVHAVPAGHDPVVTRALPTLVQVVVHG